MADLADALAHAFSNDPVDFAKAIGDGFVGVGPKNGPSRAFLTRPPFNNTNWTPAHYGVGPVTGADGKPTPADLAFPGAFRQEYRDSLEPGADQTHHLAAFIEMGTLATYYGGIAGEAGARVGYATTVEYAHQIDDFPNDPTKDNPGDVRLGEQGAIIGYGLGTGALTPGEVGSYIRFFLCNP
jgi:hypothetical protein